MYFWTVIPTLIYSEYFNFPVFCVNYNPFLVTTVYIHLNLTPLGLFICLGSSKSLK
jgi:hypothetical protein